MNDGQIDHPDQHEDPRRAPGQPAVVKGVPQGDDPGIQKQQHQLRGQTGIPDPPGPPHRLAPCRAADQRHQVQTAPTGARAAIARSAILICQTTPTKAATAIAVYSPIDHIAAGT